VRAHPRWSGAVELGEEQALSTKMALQRRSRPCLPCRPGKAGKIMGKNQLSMEASVIRALHRLSRAGTLTTLMVAFVVAGLALALGPGGYELANHRSAVSHRPIGTYLTAAGSFRASFHGTPVTQLVSSPEQTFTMVSRWVHGRWFLLATSAGRPRGRSLLGRDRRASAPRLRRRVPGPLASQLQAQLPLRTLRRAEVAPLAFVHHGQRPEPELGRPGTHARRHVRGPRC